MTDPDYDLERQLKASFEAAAGQAPHVDLADAALDQARRIRNRRRVAAGVAAGAVLAVVVPVSFQLGGEQTPRQTTAGPATTSSGPSTTTPSTTTEPAATAGGDGPVDVEIAELSRGADPKVSYVAVDTFHGPDGAVTLRSGTGVLKDVVHFADGLGVWRENDEGEKLFSANGLTSTIPAAPSVSNPAVDAQGGAAWALHGVDAAGQPIAGDTVIYTDNLTSDFSAASTGDLTIRHIMGAVDGEVVFNAARGSEAAVGRVEMTSGRVVEEPWPAVEQVTAVSPDLSRFAGILRTMTGPDQNCTAMLAYSDGAEQWNSCTWRPMEFSPDGSRVLAYRAGYDGLGPRGMAVLDPDTGVPVQQFTTSGTFGRATFEDADTIIFVVAVDRQAAIVRCDVDGACELATDPTRVQPDEPDSLLTPYQITAN